MSEHSSREWSIRLAYGLHSSKRYQKIKTHTRDILTNPEYRYRKYVDFVMIFLIITSVGVLVYEVKHSVPAWLTFYDIYVVSMIFLIEYLLRLWVFSDVHTVIIEEYKKAHFLKIDFSLTATSKKILLKKLEHITSFAAIVDLLAILPVYRPLRILRIFVLFRLFKLFRYTRNVNHFVDVLATKKFELLTLLFLLVFIVISSGIAIYVLEAHVNEKIVTLLDAVYWSMVTISTVGYGDISPVTNAGKIITMFIIVSGIAMISFATSVVVSAFYEKLGIIKTNRIIEELNQKEEFLIICGYGQLSKSFLRQTCEGEYDYIIIDKDPVKVEQAIKDGYRAIHDDASRHDVLVKFNIRNTKITLLALTQSDVENIYITLNVKSISKSIKVIANTADERMKKKYELAGADSVLVSNSVANMMTTLAIVQPVIYDGLSAILLGTNEAHMDEVMVDSESRLIGKRIDGIAFRAERLLLIGIYKGNSVGFIFNPPLDLVIEEDDVLLLMGLKISIAHFKEKMQRGYLI